MSYRDPKVIYGVTVFVVLLIMVVPISRTVTLVTKYFQMKALVSQHARTAGNGDHEQSIWKYRRMPDDSARDVFDNISQSAHSHSVIINRFDAVQSFTVDKVDVECQPVVLEGNFRDILLSLQTIADSLGDVRVASVGFRREERSKKPILVSRVVFQSAKIRQDHE